MTTLSRERPFTVSEYYRLQEAGILTEEDHVELISGRIVTMSPIGSRHAACVDRLTRLLSKQIGESAIVRVQSPILLDDYSEPEPDLTLLVPRDDFYADAHPRPTDVLLAIEVSDTSASYDREIKVPLYAKAGLSAVWLVDLQEGNVETYTDPDDGVYRKMDKIGVGELSAKHIDGLKLAVAEILG